MNFEQVPAYQQALSSQMMPGGRYTDRHAARKAPAVLQGVVPRHQCGSDLRPVGIGNKLHVPATNTRIPMSYNATKIPVQRRGISRGER